MFVLQQHGAEASDTAQHLKIINTEIFLYSDDADTKKVLTFAVGMEGAEHASATTHRDKTIINPLYLK